MSSLLINIGWPGALVVVGLALCATIVVGIVKGN